MTLFSYSWGILNNCLTSILHIKENDINEQQIIGISSYSELEPIIEALNTLNFKFSVICLQESWIDESEDISPFHLQSYDCKSQGKTCTSKGGLIIYVDDQYKSKVTFNLKTYEHWEGLVVKEQGNTLSKTFSIGNIHIFTQIISKLDNCNNDIIIAGDFNINLHKLLGNYMFSIFFDTIISHSLYLIQPYPLDVLEQLESWYIIYFIHFINQY